MTRRPALAYLVEAVDLESTRESVSDAARRSQRAEHGAEALRSQRDVIAGLEAASLALGNHDYVPRPIAEWLSNGISLYLSGRRETLDDALGLSKPGRAQPRRRKSEERQLRAALGRMFGLQVLGATIPQAAALVGWSSGEYSVSTLIDRYRRGGYTDQLRQILAFGLPPVDPEAVLAEYPDKPLEVVQAKAAIRALYAKRKT